MFLPSRGGPLMSKLSLISSSFTLKPKISVSLSNPLTSSCYICLGPKLNSLYKIWAATLSMIVYLSINCAFNLWCTTDSNAPLSLIVLYSYASATIELRLLNASFNLLIGLSACCLNYDELLHFKHSPNAFSISIWSC